MLEALEEPSEEPQAQAAQRGLVSGNEPRRPEKCRLLALAERLERAELKDSKSRFGLARVQVGCPDRLSRLLMTLTLALAWLTLAALSEIGALPKS